MLPKTEKQEVTGMKWTSKSCELCVILEDAYFFSEIYPRSIIFL